MAHDEPPHQDLRCLQIQLFLYLVLKELRSLNAAIVFLFLQSLKCDCKKCCRNYCRICCKEKNEFQKLILVYVEILQMPPGQQQAPQYGNQYGGMPQRHPNPMGMGRGPGPGPGPMKNSMVAMYQRRSNSAPYLNPQQMMQAKRSQYPNGTQVSFWRKDN